MDTGENLYRGGCYGDSRISLAEMTSQQVQISLGISSGFKMFDNDMTFNPFSTNYDFFTPSNSLDPNEKPNNSASHLDPSYLPLKHHFHVSETLKHTCN